MTTAVSTSAMAKKKHKEVQMQFKSKTINVSADKLWEIVGPGFEEAYIWSTAVDHSSGSGEAQFEGATCDNRSCDLNAKGFNKIEEKLTIYNIENKELAYNIIHGLPGFVLKANSYWKVTEISPNQSRVELISTMHTKKFMGTLMGGMLQKQIKAVIPTVLNDLKVYAETGNISDEKKQRVAKLESKSKNKKS